MELNVVKSGTWGTCLWGIDDTGFLLIGEGTGASINNESDAPWDELRSIITEIKFVGNVNMPVGSALRGAFKDCKLLTSVESSTFDTFNVVDMGEMFANCTMLKELSLTSFDTSNVKNMNRMFYGCKQLTNLDLSSFSTVETLDMHDMFSKCKKLHNITLGDRFSTVGSGKTSCGNLAIRDTGRYRMAKVVDVVAGSITYHSNTKDDSTTTRQSISGFRYLVEDNTFQMPSKQYKFLCWNTQPNGKGTVYQPGDEIENLEEDISLYAIWAAPPVIGTLKQPEEITYGMSLKFEMPEIMTETEDAVTGYIEISPRGKEGTWKQIEHNAVLPVNYDGYMMRLAAYNDYGTAYSNPVRIRIRKAKLDLTNLYWAESEDMFYDGTKKSVWLEGLPEGVRIIYDENTAVEAGIYTATATLDYDKDNFETNLKIKPHRWEIKKAKYNMSNVRWDYEKAFTFDDEEKTVYLEGLPDGVKAIYKDNSAVNVGIRTATASFEYDSDNYDKPDDVAPCVWEIQKVYIDVNTLKWTSSEDYVYDGSLKTIKIENLPGAAKVVYSGNEASMAGNYLARAVLADNYYTNGPIECEWTIRKAKHNMTTVHWSYDNPITYDKSAHEIGLVNVPSGLSVRYSNHIAKESGDYTAVATFICSDPHNYATPDDMTINWTIKKQVVDMSGARWNYESAYVYDGEAKNVELVNLPQDVYAVIENGSATKAGVYIAHANLKYDQNNLEVEQPSDCQWQIKKARYDVSDVKWNYTEPFTYDGEEKIVNLVNVPKGLNVEYQNNAKINAGKYVATAQLTPSDVVNYEIPIVNGCTWSINKAAIDRVDIIWSDDSAFEYDGSVKRVRVISDIDKNISIEYSGAEKVNAGEYEAVATFVSVDDNYEAPAPVHHRWSITKSHFDNSGIVWDYTSEFTYDGRKKEVKLVNVPEGQIIHYENNEALETGEYTATARFEIMDENNYYPLEPVELQWTIRKANYDLSGAKWQDDKVFTYDEKEKHVEIIGLPQGITAKYHNNDAVNAGEYLATVEFDYDEHNYEKPVFSDCRWKITKTGIGIGNATWDYSNPFIYNGEEQSVKLINVPEGVSVKYNNASAVNHGVYTASAILYSADNDNYTAVEVPDLIWKIEKGECDLSGAYWDYDHPFNYDGLEKTIVIKELPARVTASYNGNTAIDAGNYTATVSLSIVDNENYNTPVFPACDWTINKADYDMTGVEWDFRNAFTYDGLVKEVSLRGLPNGVKASCNGNFATSAGKYTATATLQVEDSVNYNIPTAPSCNWEIKKADFDISRVCWACDTSKEYNGRAQGMYLENLPYGIRVDYTGNEAVEVGEYVASAKLTVIDEANFNAPKINDCNWEIIKSELDMSGVIWDFIPDSFTYDGTSKKVELQNLPECIEAKYSGNVATGAGKYTATAKFIVKDHNYNTPESMVLEWYINKATCDMSNVYWDYTDEFVYNGRPHGIEVKGLPDTVVVTYDNNRKTNAGQYNAIAMFSPNSSDYEIPEPMECQWKIIKSNIDISNISWDCDQAFIYDGAEKHIELAGLPDNLNVEYYGNTGTTAGLYIARAEFRPLDENNYNVPLPVEFHWEIRKADYDMEKTAWCSERSFIYSGDTKIVVLEGYPEGIRPIYENNTAIDTGYYHADVVFEYDRENYNEPRFFGCDWNITKNSFDLSNTYWDYDGPYVFNQEEQKVVLKGLPDGLEPIYSNNVAIDAGEYEATVLFEYDHSNYEEPVFKSCRWVIEQAQIPVDTSQLEWNCDDSYEYSGDVYRVELRKIVDEHSFLSKLRGKKNLEHIAGVPADFEVFYEDNEATDVGEFYARAVIWPVGNDNYKPYELPAKHWSIKKAKVDMSNVRWDYDGSLEYDGSTKTIVLLGLPDTVSVEYTNNVASQAGTYEAQAIITLNDEVNYEKPLPFKGCLWKIEKRKFDMSNVRWDYSDNLVYNGSPQYVELTELPEGLSVDSYRGNCATEAGKYIAEAILKCEDPMNYELPRIAPLRWEIDRQQIDIHEIFWNYNNESLFVYDEQVKEVELVNLPVGVEAVYANNRRINAGTYVAKAKLVYDSKNYVAEEIPELVWKIEKANFDTSMTYWDYEGPFEFDGREKKIALKNIPNGINVRYMDNRATAIGSYTAKAYLSYNTDNYNDPNIDRTIEWEIVR